VNQSVAGLPAEGSFINTAGNGLPIFDPLEAPLPPDSETLPGEPTLSECFTGLKAQWADMRPVARWALIGSSVLSVAACGYITVKIGPIPSMRKTIRALPDLANADSVRWFRIQAARILSRMDRTAQRHNTYARLSAGALATTMALTNAYPIQQPPTELPVITQYTATPDHPILMPPLSCQQH